MTLTQEQIQKAVRYWSNFLVNNKPSEDQGIEGAALMMALTPITKVTNKQIDLFGSALTSALKCGCYNSCSVDYTPCELLETALGVAGIAGRQVFPVKHDMIFIDNGDVLVLEGYGRPEKKI